MGQIYSLQNSLKQFRILALFLLIMGSSSLVPFAQDNVKIARDWTALPEAKYMLDVSYRIIDCAGSGSYAIHLHLFNENVDKKQVSFTLKITDEASGISSEHKVIDFPIAFGAMLAADCVSENFGKLKIPIPAGYSPDKLKVEITYQ